MSKSGHLIIKDYFNTEDHHASNYVIVLNGFEVKKYKNVIFVEKEIRDKNEYYKKKLINITNEFLKEIKNKTQSHFFIKKFNLINLNSLIHLNTLNKESDHLNILRNLVILDVFKRKNLKTISYLSSNLKNFNFIKQYTNKKNIILNYNKTKIEELRKKKKIKIKLFIKKIFYIFSIAVFNIPKKKLNKLILFGYLAHFKSKKNRVIKQDYWNNLKEHISDKKIPASWAYLYYSTPYLPKIKEARKYIKYQNEISPFSDEHILLENHITYMNVFLSIFLLINYKFKIKYLESNLSRLLLDERFVALTHIRHNFLNSFKSSELFENLINFYTFKNFISRVNKNSKIIYLMENQKWEKILNYFCKLKNIKTFGFPHSGVRKMDFRYFLNNKTILESLYLPSHILCHSNDSTAWFKEMNFKNTKLKIVESLRFLKGKYNLSLRKKVISKKLFGEKNCLIFLDIIDLNSSPLLKIMKNLNKEKKYFKNIYVKIHPTANQNIFRKKYKFCKIIDDINSLKNLDYLITGSNTTSSLFSIYNKLPLLIFLRSGYMNSYPDFAKFEPNFFYDLESLKKALKKSRQPTFNNFDLHINNPEIPRWKKFLKKCI